MTNALRRKTESDSATRRYGSVFLVALLFVVLLLMRDAFGTQINKLIFVGIVGVCAVFMPADRMICLMCFLFPLYVGLPGNYITIIFVGKMLLNYKDLHIRADRIAFAFLIGIFMAVQNTVTGNTGITEMMYIPGVLLILLLFSYEGAVDAKKAALFFALGTAALGIIMLVATLQEHDFADLLTSTMRLGTDNAEFTDEEIMNVSVDPNYYGLFSITAIAFGVPLLANKVVSRTDKLLMGIALLCALAVCLIGLSRAFVLLLAVWAFLYMLCQRNLKGVLLTVLFVAVAVVLAFYFLPNVVDAVEARFRESDMADGNGRFALINEFWELWLEDTGTLLLGVGMYVCNVHCMPLQYLFGGGVLLFVLLLLFGFSLRTPGRDLSQGQFAACVPFIVVMGMYLTVPTAVLLNMMFPLVFVGLQSKWIKKGVTV